MLFLRVYPGLNNTDRSKAETANADSVLRRWDSGVEVLAFSGGMEGNARTCSRQSRRLNSERGGLLDVWRPANPGTFLVVESLRLGRRISAGVHSPVLRVPDHVISASFWAIVFLCQSPKDLPLAFPATNITQCRRAILFFFPAFVRTLRPPPFNGSKLFSKIRRYRSAPLMCQRPRA